MRVRCKFAGPLRTAAGVKQIDLDLEGMATTGAVIRLAAKRFPGVYAELFGTEAKNYYSLFVNDRLVPEKEREVFPIAEGDEVMILLPVAGGGQG